MKWVFLFWPLLLIGLVESLIQGRPTPPNAESVPRMAVGFAATAVVMELVMRGVVARAMVRAKGYHQGVMLICLAASEFTAMLGFVLSFQSNDVRYVLAFGGAALVLMLLTPASSRRLPD